MFRATDPLTRVHAYQVPPLRGSFSTVPESPTVPESVSKKCGFGAVKANPGYLPIYIKH